MVAYISGCQLGTTTETLPHRHYITVVTLELDSTSEGSEKEENS